MLFGISAPIIHSCDRVNVLSARWFLRIGLYHKKISPYSAMPKQLKTIAIAQPTYEFRIRYTDKGSGVSVASIRTGSVKVLGPNAFDKAALLISTKPEVDARQIDANYQVDGPFDRALNGVGYRILSGAEKVRDRAGNPIAEGIEYALFDIDIPAIVIPPDPEPPTGFIPGPAPPEPKPEDGTLVITPYSHRFIPAIAPLTAEPEIKLLSDSFEAKPVVGDPDSTKPTIALTGSRFDSTKPAIALTGSRFAPDPLPLTLSVVSGTWDLSDQKVEPTGDGPTWLVLSETFPNGYEIQFDIAFKDDEDIKIILRRPADDTSIYLNMSRTGLSLEGIQDGVPLSRFGSSNIPDTERDAFVTTTISDLDGRFKIKQNDAIVAEFTAERYNGSSRFGIEVTAKNFTIKDFGYIPQPPPPEENAPT